jgi:hypothetical protein
MTHFHSNSSINGAANIAQFLHTHPYVNGAVSHKNNHYLLALSLQPEAVNVFVQSLQHSHTIVATYQPTSLKEEATISIYTTDADSRLIIEELTIAFNKVSQYLEYMEIKKDYAPGYVPAHLSQWIVENDLHK